MADLVTVDEFREWSGAATQSVPDELIVMCLDEAEAGILADVFGTGGTVERIEVNAAATAVARGDEMRRAANLLARRNSPEGYAGAGDDGTIIVPAGDPGSPAAVRRISSLLGIVPVIA